MQSLFDIDVRICTMKPSKIYLPNHKPLREVMQHLNQRLSSFLNITVDNAYCTFKVVDDDFLILLSDGLSFATHLCQTILTPWDKSSTSMSPIDLSVSLPTNQYVLLIPKTFPHETYLIRSYYEACSLSTIARKLSKFFDVYQTNETITLIPISSFKLYVFSKPLHLYLPFKQSGVYLSPEHNRLNEICHIDFKDEWTIFIYDMNVILMSLIEDL